VLGTFTRTPTPAGKLDAAVTSVAVMNGPQDELFDWDAVEWRACEQQVSQVSRMDSRSPPTTAMADGDGNRP